MCVVIGLAIAACVFGLSRDPRQSDQPSLPGQRRLSRHQHPSAPASRLDGDASRTVIFQETAAARATAVVKSQLRQGLMRRVVDAGATWSSEHRTGEITQLATPRVGGARRILRAIPATTGVDRDHLATVRCGGLGDGLDFRVVLLLTLPIVLLFMVLAGLSAQRRTNDQWQALSGCPIIFLDVVEGLTTLRVFGRARAQRAVQSVTHDAAEPP